MSRARQITDAITSHSKLIIVVVMLATALVGSGATMIDDDSSLEQFEGDSPEAEAVEYIDDNFTVEESENTTTVQLIVRGDNVLTQESVLSSLRFQQEIRNHESINATLVEDDPITGVENLIAITSIIEEEGDELEERGDELEARFDELNETVDELNETADELEERGEELNETADELEEDGEELEELGTALERSFTRLQQDSAQLEQESAELEARVEVLNDTLAETAQLEVQYQQSGQDPAVEAQIEDAWTDAQQNADLDAQQNATFRQAGEQVRTITALDVELEGTIETGPETITNDPGEQDILRGALNDVSELEMAYQQAESDEERDDIEAEIDTVVAQAAADADLDQQQTTQFEGIAGDVRDTTADLYDEGPIEEAFQLGTQGVFAEEFTELEERGERLEERASGLQERADEIEERGDELEERGDQLEEDFEALNETADQLEADFDELNETADELEEEAEAIEDEADALEDRAENITLQEQIEHIESMDDEEFEEAVTETLSDDDDGNDAALGLMPSDYEPGSTSADARMAFVTQDSEAGSIEEDMAEGGSDDPSLDAQLELRDLANQQDQDYIVFGAGILFEEIDQSMGDSLAIVGPLALLFVVVALSIAYRDPLDIVLGVVGIIAVLIWTFGFMGWAGIAFNQMFVAVPVLLIGLSIDYAIHVFMRHREQRETDGVTGEVRGSMSIALVGVGIALVWVTATTAIGFLANLVSPIAPIREFGVVSAFGISAALLIFGVFVPAVKVEVDSFLESRGYDRRKRAFGTGGGGFSSVLTLGSTAARKAPLVVLVAVLLVTAGGVYGATQVDTSFDEEDFLADSPPDWTQNLPGPLSPGEYQAKEDLDYVNANFQREDSQAQILVAGDVADDEMLQRVADAESDAADSDVAYVLPSGEADIDSPLSVMEDAADQNETFNESFRAADTTGDGVPDQNVEELYDELLEVDSGAESMIYRTEDGEYEAVRLVVSIQGDASFGDTTDEMRAIAATIDDDGTDERWSAIATGDPIVSYIVEQDLLDTVLESLMITLVSVFAFLTVAYRVTGNSASLGAVTLLPVVFSVSWILGSMYLLGMPFNVLTGMITSLTVGLGVAYSIHVSSRYTLELDRQGNVWDAMYTTVTGTGGALLGSAATTVGGFGTLALAILPVLQQFGIITGLTIIYAFLASVLVLPTLLVLWTRYFGPDVSFDPSESSAVGETPPAVDLDEEAPTGGGEE